MSGKKLSTKADLVVLATGIKPAAALVGGEAGKLEYNALPELPGGIYMAGCAAKPLDISASLKQSTGMALKAIGSLKKPVS